MNLFELAAKISLDSSEYEKGLDNAKEKTSSFGEKLKSGLGTAAKIGTAAIATVTASATALAGVMVKGISNTAQYGDTIDKMSQKMGMTAESYQEWDFVMQHCGTSIESMKASMKTLATAAETDSDAFKKLGISQQDIANMSQEELFGATISALQNVSDETERTYLAGKTLGRGATELGALLNMSAEETEAMKQQIHDLGGVMSDEAVKNSAAFQDSLQNLKTATTGLSNGLFSKFLPSITTVMDGLSAIFSGDNSGLGKLSQGLNSFTKKLTDEVPKIFDAMSVILEGIITTVADNLPTMIDSFIEMAFVILDSIVAKAPDILSTLLNTCISIISTIASKLPEIFMLVVDILPNLIQSIVTALPTLLPTLINGVVEMIVYLAEHFEDIINPLIDALPDIIMSVVNALMDNLPALINGVVALAIGIVNSVDRIISVLVDMIPTIISSLVSGIIKSFPTIITALIKLVIAIPGKLLSSLSKMSEIGTNLIKGIWNGIKDAGKWLWDKISGFFGGVVDKIKGFFGIKSPSKLFASFGKFLDMGLAEGIEKNAVIAVNAMSKLSDNVADAFSVDPDIPSVAFSNSDRFSDEDDPRKPRKAVSIIQNIYSQAKTAADEQQEAMWYAERAVLTGV